MRKNSVCALWSSLFLVFIVLSEPIARPVQAQITDSPLNIRVKSVSTDDDLVSIARGGNKLTFSLEKSPNLGIPLRSESIRTDSVETFPDIFPNVDLKFTRDTNRFLEEFIVKDLPTAQKITALNESLSLSNLEYRMKEDGSIDFLSLTNGEMVFQVPKPVMYEYENREIENYDLHYEIRKDGPKIILSKVLDQKGKQWLTSSARHFPLVIDATVTIDTSTNSIPSAYSFQRKTWHDGTRYWAAFVSSADTRMEFWYSADGSTWSENASARISVNNHDFSIEADSSNAFIVYATNDDIIARQASSYPGTSFTWGDPTIVHDGTGATNYYYRPVIARDSSNYLWISSSHSFYNVCLVEDTNILLNNGMSRKIQDIKQGDVVKGFDNKQTRFLGNKVTEVKKFNVDNYYLMKTQTAVIKVTGSHLIYVGNGMYEKVENLIVGDEVYLYRNGILSLEEERITYKKLIKKRAKVFTFETNNEHNYFANNILVHNFLPPIQNAIETMVIKSTSTNNITAWGTATSLDNSLNPRTGIIISLGSGNMYAIWLDGSAIEGRKYNGSSWDASITSIATGVSDGSSKDISAVVDPSNGYIHMVYTDSSNYMVYKYYTNSWQSTTTLDANATSDYATISVDTSTNDLYATWIRNSHIYYKKADYTAGPTWTWDTNATDWKTTTSGTYTTSNYSGNGKIFVLWSEGSGSPYNVNWDAILATASNTTPTNDSLTFMNPYTGGNNDAVADNTTEWNFRALVTDADGPTNLSTVTLRLANSSDNTTPFDALTFTWTEATDSFAEVTDTQNTATITSTSANSSYSGNQWTLDYKVKFNSSFSTQSTNYNAELYTVDDAAAADTDTYTNFYQVTPITISISSPADISLGTITGIGTSSTGEATWTVTTNNPTGYKLEWQASVASMTNEYSDTISAYSPTVADTPETWNVVVSDGDWGARLKSTSTDYASDTWGSDDSTNSKWLNVKNNAPFQIISRNTATSSSSEVIQAKAQIGATKFQPTGNYTVNITLTATTL